MLLMPRQFPAASKRYFFCSGNAPPKKYLKQVDWSRAYTISGKLHKGQWTIDRSYDKDEIIYCSDIAEETIRKLTKVAILVKFKIK